MTELTDTKIGDAFERGRMVEQSESRAKAVRHDRRNSQIIVDLTNGCTFTFPPVWQGARIRQR